MTRPLVRVVKIGGSLFECPQLAAAFQHWSEAQARGWNVIVAGGGDLAEAIRRADQVHALGDEASHWLCIDALRTTSRLLAAVLGGLRLVESYADLAAMLHSEQRPKEVVFDPYQFLHDVEPQLPGPALPQNWSVTSDSIAARLARGLGAVELVIFKAARQPPGKSLAELAQSGYVDAYLPVAARELPPIQFVCPSGG